MVFTVNVPSIRALAFAAVACALGAVVLMPLTARVADAAVEGAAVQTRIVSCAGSGFYPASDVTYATEGTVRESEAYTTLRCAISLPHRAVVTRVRFTLHDGSSSGVVGPCSLKRVGLALATATTEQTMASVPATDQLDYSGLKRPVDTSISYATIDNGNYAYWLECTVNSSPLQGIVGADVTFTISSANG